MVVVAEGDILELYAWLCSGLSIFICGIRKNSFSHHLPLRLCQKLIDPADTGNRRLDRLDLHAEILDR